MQCKVPYHHHLLFDCLTNPCQCVWQRWLLLLGLLLVDTTSIIRSMSVLFSPFQPFVCVFCEPGRHTSIGLPRRSQLWLGPCKAQPLCLYINLHALHRALHTTSTGSWQSCTATCKWAWCMPSGSLRRILQTAEKALLSFCQTCGPHTVLSYVVCLCQSGWIVHWQACAKPAWCFSYYQRGV